MPAWSNGCDTIERFELSFNGRSKTEIVRREIISRKAEVISLHLEALADVVTQSFHYKSRQEKKVAGKLISLAQLPNRKKPQPEQRRIWLR